MHMEQKYKTAAGRGATKTRLNEGLLRSNYFLKWQDRAGARRRQDESTARVTNKPSYGRLRGVRFEWNIFQVAKGPASMVR
jgi:hypothetical protein